MLISSKNSLVFLAAFQAVTLQVHIPATQVSHHFPRTSIFLLFKSSKISSLQKLAVWEEASLS